MCLCVSNLSYDVYWYILMDSFFIFLYKIIMHQLVKLTGAIWLLQLVISSPLIHALGDPSQAPTGIWTSGLRLKSRRFTNWAIPLPYLLKCLLRCLLRHLLKWLLGDLLCFYLNVYLGIHCGIYVGIYFGIFAGIYWEVYLGVYSGVLFGIYFGINLDIYLGVLFGVYLDIYSGDYSLFWHLLMQHLPRLLWCLLRCLLGYLFGHLIGIYSRINLGIYWEVYLSIERSTCLILHILGRLPDCLSGHPLGYVLKYLFGHLLYPIEIKRQEVIITFLIISACIPYIYIIQTLDIYIH